MRRRIGLGASVLIVVGLVAAYFIYRNVRGSVGRISLLRQYWADPGAYEHWSVQAGIRCGDAPFLVPTDGLVGFYWGDSFRPGHRHQGVDIFGPSGPEGLGQTPVVAAYDAYLTRLPDWRSSVILRVPQDPMNPDRQIWLYYTHMADAQGEAFILPEFPPGTYERFVSAGTLLGYQGNFSADPDNPTGMHLHFSIVLDDGRGEFRNELDISNTLDPTPYLGFELNAARVGATPSTCPE
jgi:murein DD-endopeptidase MepM/ murein hydrolase activator NlpD